MSLTITTHQFQREKAPSENGACLFWSFLMTTTPYWKQIFGDIPMERSVWLTLVAHLRIAVTDYILHHREMHYEVLASQTRYKNVKDYCSAIITGELWGGDLELKILSKLHNIIICVIDPTRINIRNHLVPSFYGQDNPSAKYCIFIYYNGVNHFDPLIMKHKRTSQVQTIFRRYDLMIICILWEYIKQLKQKIIRQDKKETRDIDKKCALSPSTVSTKRKTSEIDHVVTSPNDAKLPPISIEPDYYTPNKRVKTNVESHDENIEQFKCNSRYTSTMNLLIHVSEQTTVNDELTNESQNTGETDPDSDLLKSDF